MNNVTISVVVPMYNEEEVMRETYKRLTKVMMATGETYELIFVNDGSKDKTRLVALDICKDDKNVKLIDFARNFGHQVAITAGMEHASGDAVVVIDADLQDPPEVIPEMIAKWREGYEIVYGKRKAREGETFFKKFTAKAFYRILNLLTSVDIPLDTGDFRLIDKKVCKTYCKLYEHNRFVRGIFSWMGYKSCAVEFERQARFAGTTKYPLKKMIKLACDGIFSFSFLPLRLSTFIGAFLDVLSILLLIIYGCCKLLNSVSVLILIGFFFIGLLFICLGIAGEYIARICDEVRARPIYIVSDKVNFD